MTLQTESLTEPHISTELEQLIWQTITQSAHPLKEYDLLKTLSQAGYAQFDLGQDELTLFQAHFMLFHLLYRLQNRWAEQGKGQLHIHVLDIHFDCFKTGENVSKSPVLLSTDADLSAFDPLKAYYLDFSAYYQTQSDEVKSLLEDFWRTFMHRPSLRRQKGMAYQQALTLFALEPDFDQQTLKQRFRQLRQQTHPDKGGSAAAFQQVLEAYEVLQTY
ncbi:DNA-J related domain-containing protein [Galenea microaerophila]